MLSVHTLARMAQQMASLVVGPRHRPSGAAHRPGTRVDGYGLCPDCGDWVRFRIPTGATSAPCPSCGAAITGVEPLGGDGPASR